MSRRTALVTVAVVLFAAAAGLAVWRLADPTYGHLLALLTAVLPPACWMALVDSHAGPGEHADMRLDDLLFRTGARMQDGENFESSLRGVATEGEGLRWQASSRLLAEAVLRQADHRSDGRIFTQTELESIRVARQAAAKDERGAGTLAMDIATYIKDLRELEDSLKARLKPTVSMMKTTSLVLAPIVLGVTYVIYLTLGSMMGGEAFIEGASTFFLVLGLFLAEMEAVVVFFVSGMEGRTGSRSTIGYLGLCLVISELTYAATALVASGI